MRWAAAGTPALLLAADLGPTSSSGLRIFPPSFTGRWQPYVGERGRRPCVRWTPWAPYGRGFLEQRAGEGPQASGRARGGWC